MKILYAVVVSSLLIAQAQADLGARLQAAQSQINSLRAHTDSTNLTLQTNCQATCSNCAAGCSKGNDCSSDATDLALQANCGGGADCGCKDSD